MVIIDVFRQFLNTGRRKRDAFEILKSQLEAEIASRSLSDFATKVCPRLELTEFHKTFYNLLTLFAQGRIRKLMISVPPQHGKSLGTSNLLPAFMLGLNPELRICIGSYSFSLARRFGLGVQRMIGLPEYAAIFPNTFLKGMRPTERGEIALRTADEFDIVGADGGLRLVGRECSLTGNRVDIMVLDDLYKDAVEANSPIVREAAWDWYTSVVRSRLHNDSQEIVVFTRWHEDDLIGRISRTERVLDITSLSDIENLSGSDSWIRVNFEALKSGEPTELDPRMAGEALWSARHSAELLMQKRRLDAVVFEALYQGNPTAREGLLYSEFATYEQRAEGTVKNYTDTADMGDDKLCSICYTVGADGCIYIVEVVYTAQPMEITERLVADMLIEHNVRQALVESNSGGRGFARAVQSSAVGCVVRSFHQSANKESRILTNASLVSSRVVMPRDWRQRWADFAADLSSFKRQFRANRHDDAADTLTGIVEAEFGKTTRKIQTIKFG